MNPKFCEREVGYLDLPGELFSHDPVPELPKHTMIMATISRGLSTSSSLIDSNPISDRLGGTALINAPMMNKNKYQPVIPASVPEVLKE